MGEAKEESLSIMDAIVLKHEDKHIDLQCTFFLAERNREAFEGMETEKFIDLWDAHGTKKYDPESSNNGNISDLLDSGEIKGEPYDENDILSHQRTALSGSDAVLTEQNGKVQDDGGWCDHLDHVPLINRREMLLLRKPLLHMNGTYSIISRGYKEPSVIHHTFPVKEEEGHHNSLGIGEDLAHLIAGRVNEVMYPISENCKTGNELRGAGERHGSDTSGSPVFGLHKATFVDLPCKDNYCSMLPGFTEEKVAQSAKLWFNVEAQTSEAISLSKRKPSKLKRCSRSDQSKSSCPNSTLKTIVNVKVESSDHNDVLDSRCVAVGKFNFSPSSLKREEEVQNDVFEDNLDHMLLRERMNMLTTHAGSSSDFDWLSTALPASEKIHAVLESVKPISIKCPRKRRKTVTDSVETALEEDAPGLLRVLLDSGVSVDEIKLYGDVEDDGPLDGFAELEDVISKLLSQRQTLLKFGPLRSGNDTKTTYCLACLFSLVEQTRYLQFRKWPVEWGWCRDLQSFIFIFERHKRIVLERPEYGYATYFFELVDSLPVVWQIKRLVIAMKLTSCSRVSLIENKALRVGQDLTDGEARVLMEYGWRPNSGLGTMLNYCDRVVHDRKNEIEDTSEWRAKIGKLLMDGYSGGAIVSSGILKKVMEYENPESAKVKLEF